MAADIRGQVLVQDEIHKLVLNGDIEYSRTISKLNFCQKNSSTELLPPCVIPMRMRNPKKGLQKVHTLRKTIKLCQSTSAYTTPVDHYCSAILRKGAVPSRQG